MNFFARACCVLVCVGVGFLMHSRANADDSSTENSDNPNPVDYREWTPPTLFAPSAVKVGKGGLRVRPGMEIISVDGLDILAPKGLRVRKEGSQVVYEDTGEYLSRRFDELDNAVTGLQAEVAALKKELQETKAAVDAQSAARASEHKGQ